MMRWCSLKRASRFAVGFFMTALAALLLVGSPSPAPLSHSDAPSPDQSGPATVKGLPVGMGRGPVREGQMSRTATAGSPIGRRERRQLISATQALRNTINGQTSRSGDHVLKPRLGIQGGAWEFAGPTLRVRMGTDRLRATSPMVGKASDSALDLQLTSIVRGDHALYAGGGEYAPAGDGVSAMRGSIRERLIPIVGGVEQLFDLAAPPAGEGDLTFTIAVETDLQAPASGTSANSLTFWDHQIAALTYGGVTTVDASGESITSPLLWQNGAISFQIPGEWLQQAAYPVVVDPVIGAVITVASSPQNGPYHNNDIAHNGTDDTYLSVYAETPAADNDVYAKSVNPSTGAVGSQMTILADANHTFGPTVAWNPSNNRYLVLWSNLGTTATVGAETYIIQGLILDAAFAPVGGTTPFTVATPPANIDYFGPDVASDGTNWLVTFYSIDDDGVGPLGTEIAGDGTADDLDQFARFVNGTSTNSAPSLGPILTLANSGTEYERTPAVAFGAGGNYLVVWHNMSVNGGLGGIFGRTVSTAGVLGTTTEYDDTADVTNNREEPAVAANTTNNEFLVGWDQWDGTSFLGDPIVRRVSSAGALIGGAGLVNLDSDLNADAFHVTIVWNAAKNQYLVSWYDDAASSPQFYDLEASRLNGPDLTVLQANFALATMQSGPTGYGLQNTSAASRTGTTHVIMQFRVLPWDGVSALVPPFPVQAQRFDMNSPPADPVAANLQQDQGATVVAPGDAQGTTYATNPKQESFTGGTMTDPDGDQVRLEVEVVPFGSAFTGAVTAQSGLVASGNSAVATLSAIANGQYIWRARFTDALGASSNWVEFGPAANFDYEYNIPNFPPADPLVANLDQDQGATVVAGGDPAGTTYVAPPKQESFTAGVMTDPDGDQVRLEVEVVPNGALFTGTVSAQSGLVNSGNSAIATLNGIANGQYKWRARVTDSLGASSNWVEFDPPAGFDFEFNVPNSLPNSPAGLAQFQSDGVTAIALGGASNNQTVVFSGTVSDPDLDTVRLEVEIKDINTAFDGATNLFQGALVASGGTATVTVSAILPRDYHWRARTVDSLGAVSAFVAFGANGDVPPAGIDFVINAPPLGGSRNKKSCFGGAATGLNGAFAAVLLLGVIAVLRRK